MAQESIRENIKEYITGRPHNLSLLFNRLCPMIDEGGDYTYKDKTIKGMLAGYSTEDTLPVYKAALKNWQKTMERDPAITCFEMKTISPMIIGKGDQNVHEFGITLQLPWGTPVIPGTAIKGVLSSFAHKEGGDDWNKGALSDKNNAISPFSGKYALVMFGGSDDSEESFAGCLDFFNAWWVPGKSQGKPFSEDIINVHNRFYYQDETRERFPDGMDDPVFNKFVVVKPGEKFFFAIKGSVSWRNLAKEMLLCAAKENGFGAKTRLGYGRLDYCKGISDIIDELPDMDDKTLTKIFEEHKGKTALHDAFAREVQTRKYNDDLKSLFRKFRPVLCFLADLEAEKDLNWKAVKRIHKGYKNTLRKFGIDRKDPDVQSVFDLCFPFAPNDFSGTWFEAFAPSAEDYITGKTVDQIENLLKQKKKWPPFNDFKTAINQAAHLDDDAREYCLIVWEEELKKLMRS